MRRTFRSVIRAAAYAALLVPAVAHAQQQPPPVDHSAHGTPQPGAADDCMTAQSKVSVTGAMALERLEAARQTNEPATLRAAVDEALLALNALLAATEPCRKAPPAGGMDHATMTGPPPGAPVSPRPPAAAADPHAGHAAPPAAATPAKPAPKPADPHAGHAAPPKPGAKPAPKPAAPRAGQSGTVGAKTTPFATDPKKLVCAQAVDPDTAPSTTYKGKAYYFCSAADRLRFIMNPETALKGAGGR